MPSRLLLEPHVLLDLWQRFPLQKVPLQRKQEFSWGGVFLSMINPTNPGREKTQEPCQLKTVRIVHILCT